ncbi:MAG: nucleotidyl transferase AbiEii/AbiGii toxin family protein [Candidatus Zambryskibacteria bacterium]
MHLETLTENARRVWDKIQNFENIKNFYLAGGTALALQIGHRISVDLDFFSDQPIKKTLLKDIEEFFGKPVEVLVKSKDELTIVVDEVKITFLHYYFPLIYSLKNDKNIKFADISEISLMKAYSLGRRQSFKDYVDMYTVVSNNLTTLKSIVENAKNKYGGVFNDRVFLEQLVYVDDIEDEPIQWINKLVSKEEIRDFFEIKIKEYFDNI